MIRERAFYTVGGTVQAGGGIYITREADDELFQLCNSGHFARVLTAQQMGKSSLMVNTAKLLAEEGILAVIIDLNQIGTHVTTDEWYLGILTKIEEELDLSTDVFEWWDAWSGLAVTHRLTDYFQYVLLNEVKRPVVIFFDEIDSTTSLPFNADDFFSAIRYMHNARAHIPEFGRLSFVLIGAASAAELIGDPKRTPFNVGESVDLTDFTPEEALPLTEGLGLQGEEARQVLSWIFEWTSGHPFLTVSVCQNVRERFDEGKTDWTSEDVAAIVAANFFAERSPDDKHLQFVRDMLTKRAPDREQVLITYAEIRRGRRIADEEQSQVKTWLKLSGVVKREGGALVLRNRIYETVFNKEWVKPLLPTRFRKAFRKGLASGAAAAFTFFVITAATIGIALRARFGEELTETQAQATIRLSQERAYWDSVEVVRQAEQGRVSDSLTAAAEAARDSTRLERETTEERFRLTTSSRLADGADNALQVDPELALLLALEAVRVMYPTYDSTTTQSLAALRRAGEQSRVGRRLAVQGHSAWETLAAGSDTLVAVAGPEGVILWNPISGKRRRVGGATGYVSLAFSPDNRSLAALEASGSLVVWDVASGDSVSGWSASGQRVIAFSPDGNTLAAVGSGMAAILWNPATGAPMILPVRHRGRLTSLAFSRDGVRLATASRDGTARVWEAATGDSLATTQPPHDGPIWSVIFSPDGRQIATASRDSTAKTWDRVTGRRINDLRGHTDEVHRVAFSPSGNLLATASFDRTARIWDAQNGREILVLRGHGDRVLGIAFLDEQTLITASRDGTVRTWDVSSRRATSRTLSVAELLDRYGSRVTRGFTPEECLDYRLVDVAELLGRPQECRPSSSEPASSNREGASLELGKPRPPQKDEAIPSPRRS